MQISDPEPRRFTPLFGVDPQRKSAPRSCPQPRSRPAPSWPVASRPELAGQATAPEPGAWALER
ncbi:MAG TPA: hypothetical protein ENK18_21835 [Deltaproteobacteria bacterium]|nr:hypothetical protein [Deltaproteobacteria bacterium]